MTREEAIKVLKGELTASLIIFGEKNDKETQDALRMAIQALENWAYLKEHITEMRDADGKLNQKKTCQYILNLMKLNEIEGEAK